MRYRTLFEETITHEPPPRHTVDGLVVRYRRQARARRLAGAGAGAAASALALAAVAAVTVPGPRPAPAAPTSAAAPAKPGPTPTRTLLGVAPTEDPGHARERLAGAIRTAVDKAAPGVRIDGALVVERHEVPAGETGDGGVFEPSFFYETAQPAVHAPGADGVLSVGLMRRFVATTCEPSGGPPARVSCDTSTGPGGEHVVVTTITGATPGGTSVYVAVDRPDGSTVTAGVEYTGPTPPIRADQLRAVALDRTVTLYP
ncbi:hypothetical protein [Dactylosporangium sp. NPDC048998]|uniref:hypothetical protein n=1 Tax=Dactylosporangium sp. NPDC048998 TaxID=3363976 RepID=UPI0037162ACA